MVPSSSAADVRLEVDDFLGAALLYIVGFLVALLFGFVAVVLWSFFGLFAGYLVARQAAQLRTVRESLEQIRLSAPAGDQQPVEDTRHQL